MTWVAEEIADDQHLYYRVHVSILDGNELVPAIFREQKGDMSTDWAKYSTPKQSLQRSKVPADNGIIGLVAGEVRSLELNVTHTPDALNNNRAHTSIFGLSADPTKKTRLRHDLLKIVSGWIIPPSKIA